MFADAYAADYSGWVFETDDTIRAFIIVQFAGDQCEILNLCVDAAARRQGIGQKLVQHALAQAEKKSCAAVFLEVRASNIAAIKLYESLGFSQTGLRRDYYPGDTAREDAVLMSYAI